MRTFLFQIIWLVAVSPSLFVEGPGNSCTAKPWKKHSTTAEQTSRNTLSTTQTPTSATSNQTTPFQNTTSTTTTTQRAGTNVTTTKETSSADTHQTTTGFNTTVIVAASVGTCVAVILLVLFFLIRRRHILRNCNFPHKQPGDKKSTSFSNNMYPDIEGTANDSGYAEIPLDNVDSINNEDNVYQTIDPLQEQETVIDDKYSHILSGNAWPLTNASYSHIAGDFQSKRVVPDYTHIEKLEGNTKGDLKLKRNESDTSYDIIGKTKIAVTENPNVMESTYNHTHNETNQTRTSKSGGGNYSHLHDLTKTMLYNETMMNSRYNIEFDEPGSGSRLKEGDVEPKSIDKREEKELPAVVKLPEASKFALTENCEENAVDHQYFVLEKVDKTEEKEPPAVD